MGLSWGLGHGTTLAVLGLPLVLYGSYMPEPFQRITEVGVGAVIIFLAVRLLYRWRRDVYHAHGERLPHRHTEEPSYDHYCVSPTRTAPSAYGIGLLHGTDGSGGSRCYFSPRSPTRHKLR